MAYPTTRCTASWLAPPIAVPPFGHGDQGRSSRWSVAIEYLQSLLDGRIGAREAEAAYRHQGEADPGRDLQKSATDPEI